MYTNHFEIISVLVYKSYLVSLQTQQFVRTYNI